MIKKIAILTSGGDSPGMNNAVRAIVKTAKMHGIEPMLVYEGYKGLHTGLIQNADDVNVDKFINVGGTFLGSSRYLEFKTPSVREETKKRLDSMGIDALVVIGGDGSYRGAQLLHELGVKTIGLPGTIDNDIASSELTIGYPTALQTITDAIDKLRDTMNSHNRMVIVEVMGHGCGDLALYSGLATGAEIIITNENVMTEEEIAATAKAQRAAGKRAIVCITSEFIYPDLKATTKKVEQLSGVETRSIVLSHLQRGGNPTAIERINATRMGIKAVELLVEGQSGLAVGIMNNKTTGIPILEALEQKRIDKKSKAILYNKINQS